MFVYIFSRYMVYCIPCLLMHGDTIIGSNLIWMLAPFWCYNLYIIYKYIGSPGVKYWCMVLFFIDIYIHSVRKLYVLYTKSIVNIPLPQLKQKFAFSLPSNASDFPQWQQNIVAVFKLFHIIYYIYYTWHDTMTEQKDCNVIC